MNIHHLYRPFLKYFRTKRMRKFQQAFEVTSGTRVLDVGGTLFNWSLLNDYPMLTLVNISTPKEKTNDVIWVIADGRHLPFKDSAFDIVYSNSVIEHLGTFDNQQRMASECSRVGQRYYVQTPNRWFPVEPHLITPIIHWLPRRIQRLLLRNFTVWGLITRPSPKSCDAFLNEVRLLDEREMRQLFPNADIWYECVLWMTKSFVAAKK